MTKRILPAFLFILGAVLLVGAGSCSGARNKTTIRPAVHGPGVNALTGSTAPCEIDEDCGLIKAGCCACNMGGKREAILKSRMKEREKKFAQACGNMMCAAVISTDPSCAEDIKPKCEAGACVLK